MKQFRVTAHVLLSAVGLFLGGLAVTSDRASAAMKSALQHPFAMAPAAGQTRLVYVANYQANSITAYPAGASGNVRPVIALAGPHTRLVSPLALAHDPQGRLFVVSFDASLGVGEVLVFARGASGDAAPVRSFRVSSYPSGGVNVPVFPVSLAVDWSGYTYVGVGTNIFGDSPAVSVYSPGAQGAAAPLRVFDGGGSSFAQPQVAVNGAGQVYAIEPEDRNNGPYLAKFTAFADGNRYLGGRYYGLGNDFSTSGGVAVAPRSGNVYALNGGAVTILNAAFTNVVGYIRPSGGVSYGISGIAVDGSGDVFVGVPAGTLPGSVLVFGAGAHGTVAASRIIGGSNTGLSDPVAITLID